MPSTEAVRSSRGQYVYRREESYPTDSQISEVDINLLELEVPRAGMSVEEIIDLLRKNNYKRQHFSIENIGDENLIKKKVDKKLAELHIIPGQNTETLFGIWKYIHDDFFKKEMHSKYNPGTAALIAYNIAQSYGFTGLTLERGEAEALFDNVSGPSMWVLWKTKNNEGVPVTYRFNPTHATGVDIISSINNYKEFVFRTRGFEIVTQSTEN